MHVDRVAAAGFPPELADGLEEGQRLDVADRAADLDEDDVGVGADAADRLLDLVGDVGNDLHGLAEVVAPPLPLDHRRVDASRRRVVDLRAGHRGEALVVPEVQVRLGAVVGDVDLAVLEGRHRAGIHVDVGIELGHRDREASGLEQRPDRGRRDALAERGHHAPGDEDVLRAHAIASFFRRRSASLQIRRRVHADRIPGRLSYPDRITRLQPPELLERLRAFERRRGQRRHLGQRVGPIGVDPEVLAVRRRRRSGSSGIAEREKYSARPSPATATLTVFGSAPAVGGRPDRERRDGAAAGREQRLDGAVDVLRRHERLVALEVHVRVGGKRARHFGHAIRAALPPPDEVIRASPPAARTQAAIRSSSVATTTRSSRFAERAASHTCSTMGLPARGERGFPGNRMDANRAGITPMINMQSSGLNSILARRACVNQSVSTRCFPAPDPRFSTGCCFSSSPRPRPSSSCERTRTGCISRRAARRGSGTRAARRSRGRCASGPPGTSICRESRAGRSRKSSSIASTCSSSTASASEEGPSRPGDPLALYEIADLLVEGRNRVAVEAASSTGIGGVLLALDVEGFGRDAVVTDGSWRVDLAPSALAEGGRYRPVVWGKPPQHPWGYPRMPRPNELSAGK